MTNEPIIILGGDAPEDQWLAERKNGIGASEGAAILGVSRYGKGAADIYLDKISDEVKPLQGLFLEIGHALEPFVAAKFEQCFPDIQVIRSQQLLAHAEYPFIRATPDCFLVRTDASGHITKEDMAAAGLLEIKTTWAYTADADWSCPDDAPEIMPGCFLAPEGHLPPDDVQVQWQQQAFVTGLRWGYVAVAIGNRKMIFYPMTYDAELVDTYLVPKLSDFWHNHVATKTPPALGGTDASKRLVDMMYPATEAEVPDEIEDLSEELVTIDPAEAAIFGLALPPDNPPMTALELLALRDRIQGMIDMYEGQKALCDNVLKTLVGNRTCALIGRKVNFSITTSMVIDMEKAQKEDAALVTKVDKYKTALAAAEDLLKSRYGSRKPTGRSWKPGKPKKGC